MPFLFLPTPVTCSRGRKRKAVENGTVVAKAMKFNRVEAYVRFCPQFEVKQYLFFSLLFVSLNVTFFQTEELMEEFDKKRFGAEPVCQIRAYLIGSFDGLQLVCIKFANASYQFVNTLEGFIFYYKIHQALQVIYPPQCTTTWLFIESFLLSIITDKLSPQVSTLINELKVVAP